MYQPLVGCRIHTSRGYMAKQVSGVKTKRPLYYLRRLPARVPKRIFTVAKMKSSSNKMIRLPSLRAVKVRKFRLRSLKVVRTLPPGVKLGRSRPYRVLTKRVFTSRYPSSYSVKRVFERDFYRYIGFPETRNATYDTGSLSISSGGDKSGVSNPNWKVQIRNGLNASTNFAASRSSQTCKRAMMNIAYRAKGTGLDQQTGYRLTGYFTSWNLQGQTTAYTGGAALDNKADDMAIKRLHKAVERSQHQFQGGVFVAELHKAVKMVVRPAKALQDAMVTYVRNSRKRIKGLQSPIEKRKVLANLYLEATFGWQPLLSDVQDAAKGLARFNNPRAEKRRFKVAGEAESNENVSAYSTIDGYAFLFCFNRNDQTKHKSTVIYYGDFQGGVLDPNGATSSAERLVNLSGFDLRSFIPTVWEIIPFSFVVDYFTNVGDVLQAYSHCSANAKNLTRVGIKETTNSMISVPDVNRIYTQLRVNFFVTPATHEIFLQVHPISSNASYRSVNRSTPGSIPMPTLQLELPGYDHWKQWLNLGALYTALVS